MSGAKKRGIDNSVQGLYNGDKFKFVNGGDYRNNQLARGGAGVNIFLIRNQGNIFFRKDIQQVPLLLALVFCLGLVPFASADNSPFSDVP